MTFSWPFFDFDKSRNTAWSQEKVNDFSLTFVRLLIDFLFYWAYSEAALSFNDELRTRPRRNDLVGVEYSVGIPIRVSNITHIWRSFLKE